MIPVLSVYCLVLSCDDLLIKHSNKLLEAAEKQKAHFRKTVNSLEKELENVYNDWEASEITNREEGKK